MDQEWYYTNAAGEGVPIPPPSSFKGSNEYDENDGIVSPSSFKEVLDDCVEAMQKPMPSTSMKEMLMKSNAALGADLHHYPVPAYGDELPYDSMVEISLPPLKGHFIAGSTNAPDVKAKMMAIFEEKLDKELEKYVLSGELAPTPWEVKYPTYEETFGNPWKQAQKFADQISTYHYFSGPKNSSQTYSPDAYDNGIVQTLKTAFPKAMYLQAECPVGNCTAYGPGYTMTVEQLVPHLNDRHKWKTTQIAEWMENQFDAKDLAS